MKRKQHLKYRSYTSRLLLEIGDGVFDIFEGLEYPDIAAHKGLDCVREYKRGKIFREEHQAMRRLKQLKYISVQKLGDKLNSKLSEEGVEEYLYQRIMRCEQLPEGYFCLVVFDIPEDRRELRRQLRNLLTNAVFMPLQKSVWASQFDASKEIALFLKYKGRKKWVRIFKAVEIE